MSMFKPCPQCERSNNLSARQCKNCGYKFNRNSAPEKPPFDPRCHYESNGARCPAIATTNISYDASGDRYFGLCRYHARSRGDRITSDRLLESFHRKGPPAQPRHWADIMIDKHMQCGDNELSRNVSRMEWDEYTDKLAKIQPASRVSEAEKAQRVTGIQATLRGLPSSIVQRSGTGNAAKPVQEKEHSEY